MLPCLCLTTGVAPTVVAAQAAQEVAVRGDGNKSYLGLSDVSELWQRTRRTGVRSQSGAQELHLY